MRASHGIYWGDDMGWLSLILPAFIPTIADSVRAVVGKFTGAAGAQPQNVDEAIRLMEAQTARVQALAELDKMPDGASKWVINLRGSYRYIVVSIVELVTLVAVFSGVDSVVMVALLDLAGACMVLIIGERMHINLRGASK